MNNKVSEKAIWEGSISPDNDVPSWGSQMQTQPQMMFCYKCNNVIPNNSKFCPYCQIKLFTECPKCGTSYSSQYPACGQCGTNREEYLRVQKIEQVTYSPKNEINGHEYVDLGLPSGLKWATCNIGANKPEEYGDYFAWGEVVSKKKYSLLNYKVSLGLRMREISGTQYDAARYNWGGSWRLPSKLDFQELINICTINRTNQNGKEGYKITGPNGNYIFFPVAGHYNGTLLTLSGECGHYLSSSPKNTLNAYIFGVKLSTEYCNVGGACREMGYSVRPVSG